MNTSNIQSSIQNNDYIFGFDRLHIKESELASIRYSLYHSEGDGYLIIRNFISPEFVSHIRDIWPRDDKPVGYEILPDNNWHYKGCPNYYVKHNDGSYIYYNFLHSAPLDEVTQEVCVAVHILRNRISGRNAFADITGETGLCYRVTLNKNFSTWIGPHTDWMDWERRWEKGQYDPSRLQATLFLSEYGVDYSDGGFKFTSNNGNELLFGRDIILKPGDLLIWRYSNLHSVEDVKSSQDQFGFMRILFPVYDLNERKINSKFDWKQVRSIVRNCTPNPMLKLLRKLKET